MLPKPLYEIIPYLYLGGGALGILFLDNAIGWACGGLLYGAGALVWVLRSNHRRRDRTADFGGQWWRTNSLYEFRPFALIAAALILMVSFNHLLVFLAAVALCLLGLYQFGLRHQSRQLGLPPET